MDKLLITGINSFVGSNVARIGRERFEVTGTYYSNPVYIECCDIQKMDIRDRDNCFKVIKENKPNLIVHCVGLSDQDISGLDISYLRKVNVEGTKNILDASKAVGAKIVYVSTDWVFDGRKQIGGKYSETDSPAPVNNYGITKYEGELVTKGAESGWLIVRPANVYGVNQAMPTDRTSLADYVANRGGRSVNIILSLEKGMKVKLPSDVYQCPTLATHHAETILDLYEKGMEGIFHACGRTCISRYEFFRELARRFGLNEDLITPVTKEEFATTLVSGLKKSSIEIPWNCCMEVRKIEEALGRPQLEIYEGLEIMVKQFDSLGKP